MKLSIVKRLIEALASKQYIQGSTRMRFTTKYNTFEWSVFGVLCDIYLREMKLDWQNCACLGWVMYPPPEVDKWAGMTMAFRNKLQQWEDYDHLTFIEIADKLREEVKNAESRRVQNRDTNRPGQGKGRG